MHRRKGTQKERNTHCGCESRGGGIGWPIGWPIGSGSICGSIYDCCCCDGGICDGGGAYNRFLKDQQQRFTSGIHSRDLSSKSPSAALRAYGGAAVWFRCRRACPSAGLLRDDAADVEKLAVISSMPVMLSQLLRPRLLGALVGHLRLLPFRDAHHHVRSGRLRGVSSRSSAQVR